MDQPFSYNRQAVELIEKSVLPRLNELRIEANALANGTTIIDMGVNCLGCWTAAKYFVLIGLGGRGEVEYGKVLIDGTLIPTVNVYVTQPIITEMSSHVAYWNLRYGTTTIVISGPIRAIQAPDMFSQTVSYRDVNPGCGVAMIQTDQIPDEALTQMIAEQAGIPADKLYVIVAKTASIVGSVQVPARNVEQTLPSLYDHGFEVRNIVQAYGISPIVAIVSDEDEAYGRVNDCLLYGQETTLWVDCSDQEIESVLPVLTFDKNKDIYGMPFKELFRQCGRSWANVPRDWDAPCKVNFHNIRTGHSFSIGTINENVLLNDFKGEVTC
jgi:methenyltetrahydromethanopterin cyclohydrolase